MGKSEIKKIFRAPPFNAALSLVDDCRTRDSFVGASAADEVRVVFEDASIRSASGITGTGDNLLETFMRPIVQCFAAYPNVHTYVLSFDKRQFVPPRKGTTQDTRRDALLKTIEREAIPEWQWDGTSAIVERDAMLPPWKRIRLDSCAYMRTLEELVELVCSHIRLPPNRRLIVDAHSEVPQVLESDHLGRMLRTYNDESLRNDAGEADMMAQLYARRARDGSMVVPTRPHELLLRERCTEHEQFYESSLGDDPIQLRSRYEPGSIVLRSTDTDYLSLSILHYALHNSLPHNVFVALGATTIDARGKFCTKRTAGARLVHEIYNVAALNREIHALHPSASLLDAVASFSAFCLSCGSDYVLEHFYYVSHALMYRAYRHHSQLLVDVVAAGDNKYHVTLNRTSFRDFLRTCFHHREFGRSAIGRRVVPWETLVRLALMRDNEKLLLPNDRIVHQYTDSVAWNIIYACVAPVAFELIPSNDG